MYITAPVPKCLTVGDFLSKMYLCQLLYVRTAQIEKKNVLYFFHWYTPIYTIVKFIIKKSNLKSYHFENANFMSIVVQNLRCLIWVESFSYVICLACVILVVIAEVVVVFYIQILFWTTGSLVWNNQENW